MFFSALATLTGAVAASLESEFLTMSTSFAAYSATTRPAAIRSL